MWKHSIPARILIMLALAWEHSLTNSLWRWGQQQVSDSFFINAGGWLLAPDRWEGSWWAHGLERAGTVFTRVLALAAGGLGRYGRHALAWRWGQSLVAWSQDAHSVHLLQWVFPFTKQASWVGWSLAAFAFIFPFLPTSMNLLTVWFLAVAVLLGHCRLLGARPSPLTIALGLFAAALLWATAGSLAWQASLTALLLWATYLALYLAAKKAAESWANAQTMVMALMTGGAILSALALAQWFMGVETSAAWVDVRLHQDITTRAFSVFDNPNILANHLALLVPLALLALVAYQRMPIRAFSLACGGLMGAGLLVTLSRGALLAVFFSLSLIAVFRDRRYVVVLLVLAVLFIALSPPVVLDRLIGALTFEDSSARYRTTIWRSSWRLLQDYWFTGAGLGPASFAQVYPLYRIAGTPAAHTHNLYLQLVVELGLAGALAFGLFMLAWARRLLSRMGRPTGWLIAAIVAAIGGAALHGLAENIWYSPKSLMLFWMLLGLGSGLASDRASGEETV